jgi:aspartate aminotransferase
MIKLSHRAMQLKPSATLSMAAKARKMRAEGTEVVSFAAGEPDFDTPANIRDAAKRALDEGQTRYTPSSGILELKAAVRGKLARDNGLEYADDEVIVACGAKHAIFNALQAIVDPGDEVIVPAPYWVSYPDQVRLAAGTPVIVPTDAKAGFKLTPAEFERAATPKTRAVILNYPSNPTGSTYSREELAALGEAICRRGAAIISDEIYEKLVYGGKGHTSIAAAHPPAKDLTIVVNGVSKSYAMTGWRMGYAAGPRQVIAKMAELTEQQISGIPGFVQRACVEAMEGPQAEVERMRTEFAARRDLMLERLLAIPGLSCRVPDGAFYLLPDISAYLGRKAGGTVMANATALAEYLLSEAHVATVSGDPFGAQGHIRLSYATSRKNIEEGVRRISAALARLA